MTSLGITRNYDRGYIEERLIISMTCNQHRTRYEF